MKKFLLVAAAATLFSSTSVFAQSANDAMFYDRAADPAYQGARSNQGYAGYYTVPSCFMFTCLLGHGGHKPRDGELRILPDGTAVMYDKTSKRWLVVHEPAEQPRGVYTDRDVYAAK